MIQLSRFFRNEEKEQLAVATPAEAREFLTAENAKAAPGWRWQLSASNFVAADGTEISLDEANAIRRACGQDEW